MVFKLTPLPLAVVIRSSFGLIGLASLMAMSIPVQADTQHPVRWGSGAKVWTTNLKDFEKFLASGETTDRALKSAIYKSGLSADEIRAGMTKSYEVDVSSVTRFLYTKEGIKFLENKTSSYSPYWEANKTAVVALRSAIIADSVDGTISSQGILEKLPVAFRFSKTCSNNDRSKTFCTNSDCGEGPSCNSLLSLYMFMPACVQAGQNVTPRTNTFRRYC